MTKREPASRNPKKLNRIKTKSEKLFVNIFDDYVVLDVDCDGQARRRVNSAECFRVRGGVRVADINCPNFYHPIEGSVPLDYFSQELTRFLQGLPIVCYRVHYIRELIEYELHFHGFDGFISYVGIEEIAKAKFKQDLQFWDLMEKFDLCDMYSNEVRSGEIFATWVFDIHRIYEKLKQV